MGVPLSQLQGQPTPLTVDLDGEKVTALLASPWKPEDVAAALAVQQAADAECPGCGGDLAVTTDDAHQFDWVAEAIKCHNCKARQRESDLWDSNREGLLIRSRFERDERMAR